MLIRILLPVLCAALLSVTAAAQVPARPAAHPQIDPAQIDALVQQTQTFIDAQDASRAQLDDLRSDLVEQRELASQIIDAGSVEARALQAQIDSLGPAPADGETEAEDIAVRRQELEEALAVANKPIRDANEALQQTNLLIGEVDKLIRAKGTQQLLTRLPSPLLPGTWSVAAADLNRSGARLSAELSENFASPDFQKDRGIRLIIATSFAVVGLLLILVAQPLATRYFDRIYKSLPSSGRRWAVATLSNLARLLLPLTGAGLLLLTVPALHISTFITDTIEVYAFAMALIVVGAHWLGHRIFAPTIPERRMLPLDDRQALRGLRLCQVLGLVAATELFLEICAQDVLLFRRETFSVVAVPVFLVSGVTLWRLSNLVRLAARNFRNAQADPDDSVSLEGGIATVLVGLLRAAAVLPLLFTLVGYVKLSQQFADAMVMTVFWLGLALFLYNAIVSGAEALTGRDQEDSDTLPLLPVVVVFLLALLFAPLLAISWGARTTDIAEAWRVFSNGIQMGDTNLSLSGILKLLIVLTLGILATGWFKRLLRETVLPRTRLDSGARSSLITGIGYAGYTLAALIAVSAAGLNLSSLAWIVGALSVGIGFGLQTIVSNFVSGIILLVERPIKEGDWIEVSGYSGTVRKIAVRSTRIETFDRHDVIVPNQDLIAGTVKNMTLTSQSGRLILPVGVAYGSDLEKTREILDKAARENDTILPYPEPQVLFMGLGDSSLDFELRCFLKDIGDIMTTRSALLFDIYLELNKAGIEIPFPQRDLHLRDIDRLVVAIEGRRARTGNTGERDDSAGQGDQDDAGGNDQRRDKPIAARPLPEPEDPDHGREDD